MNELVVLLALSSFMPRFASEAGTLAAIQDQLGASEQGDTSLVLRRIWKGGQYVFELVAPSPDGRYLSGVDWTTGNLSVLDLKAEPEPGWWALGGQGRPVTSAGSWMTGSAEWAESSVFSPDGLRLAYTWWSDHAGGYGVRVIGLDGSNPRVLLEHSAANRSVSVEDWSRDGTQLLIALLGEDDLWRLMLVSVDDGQTRVLKTLGERAPLVAAISPDGRFVAYDLPSEREPREHDIYALAVAETQETELVGSNGDDRLMGWTPAGRNILFYSDRELTRGIWRLPVVNSEPAGEPELLQADIWQLVPLGFSRDKFFYAVITEAFQVHAATLDIETGRVLTPATPITDPSEGESRSAAWSPDGEQLAYLWRHHGDATWQLAVRSLGGGDTQLMPFPFVRPQRIDWVPDTRSVMVFGMHHGQQGLFRLDLRSGEVAPLFTGAEVPEQLYFQASFSPDGNMVYFPREVDSGQNHWRIVVRDLSSGREREIATVEAVGVLTAVSPDGRMLALAAHDPAS